MGQEVSVLKPAKAGKVFDDPGSSPLEVLERARLVLSPRGAWRHGGFTGTQLKTGVAQRCAIQAIRDCDGKHAVAAEKLLKKAIWELHPGFSEIARFNDAKNRIKAEVLAVFDRAIELAKEGK